jgi:hypothetical protein
LFQVIKGLNVYFRKKIKTQESTRKKKKAGDNCPDDILSEHLAPQTSCHTGDSFEPLATLDLH